MFEQTFKNIDDILRKEAGCATELDYEEQISWILFLKYLDALEVDRQNRALLTGEDYDPLLDEPYRWSNWAYPKDGRGELLKTARVGDDLIEFVNTELFPYFQGFKEYAEPGTFGAKIGEIFAGVRNISERVQPAGSSRKYRPASVSHATAETRAFGSLRNLDQKYGQRRAKRGRVLHPAAPDPGDDSSD
ncbi:type I restriction-modification system subunit M N-terminal domain-containing protein [Microcystis aeruginosa]|uniref:type I restriction-modification system subunit M N-terminal domain-containing protein n=1 Tax=Microcystis aeruginosa TaxID=1126 RepID=UPI001E59D01D|nr:type I restriction-modification system subunit M N-terminal domain-containing protein [Microcystis aeruginosa]